MGGFIIKVLDNKIARIGDEVKVNIEKGSKLSIIASYFSIYTFEELRKELDKIDELRFIYTNPLFSKDYNSQCSLMNINKNIIGGDQYEVKLRNKLGNVS